MCLCLLQSKGADEWTDRSWLSEEFTEVCLWILETSNPINFIVIINFLSAEREIPNLLSMHQLLQVCINLTVLSTLTYVHVHVYSLLNVFLYSAQFMLQIFTLAELLNADLPTLTNAFPGIPKRTLEVCL